MRRKILMVAAVFAVLALTAACNNKEIKPERFAEIETETVPITGKAPVVVKIYRDEETTTIDDSTDSIVDITKETEAEIHTDYYVEEEPVVEEPVYYEEIIDYGYDSDSDTVAEPEPDYEFYENNIDSDGSIDSGAGDSDVVPEEVEYSYYGLSDDEIWNIARITWLETGICDYYTQYLTACVLINRLLDWPGYYSIYDVIYDYGQYATAYQYVDWGGGSLNISGTTWAAVYDALENTDRNPHFQCSYAPGFSLYYLDTTYDVYFYY